jgi:pimeloyl-ACP methyl ester carboxylesterase
MPHFDHDGLSFHYIDVGEGTPFLFQHGLGGALAQPLGVFHPAPLIRFLSFDCRGHGETEPLGDLDKIGITAFTDDMAAMMDHVGVGSAVVGGISMGAALALRFARRFPDRVLGLVLSRPAWLTGPTYRNVEIYSQVAATLVEYGAKKGLEWLMGSALYREILDESPDNAASLVKQFQAPDAQERAVRLDRIPRDQIVATEDEFADIRVPTLVLASRQDVIHPFEFGVALERLIPSARLTEITPKSVDERRHVSECGEAILGFLRENFPDGEDPPC